MTVGGNDNSQWMLDNNYWLTIKTSFSEVSIVLLMNKKKLVKFHSTNNFHLIFQVVYDKSRLGGKEKKKRYGYQVDLKDANVHKRGYSKRKSFIASANLPLKCTCKRPLIRCMFEDQVACPPFP